MRFEEALRHEVALRLNDMRDPDDAVMIYVPEGKRVMPLHDYRYGWQFGYFMLFSFGPRPLPHEVLDGPDPSWI